MFFQCFVSKNSIISPKPPVRFWFPTSGWTWLKPRTLMDSLVIYFFVFFLFFSFFLFVANPLSNGYIDRICAFFAFWSFVFSCGEILAPPQSLRFALFFCVGRCSHHHSLCIDTSIFHVDKSVTLHSLCIDTSIFHVDRSVIHHSLCIDTSIFRVDKSATLRRLCILLSVFHVDIYLIRRSLCSIVSNFHVDRCLHHHSLYNHIFVFHVDKSVGLASLLWYVFFCFLQHQLILNDFPNM